MTSASAQYLLRFDDLCPTMSKERWERFKTIVSRHGIRPILAVVPDNQDPELKIDDPDPGFWDQMRALEAGGATIAMHGYRHRCESVAPSLLGLHRNTEFAGIDEETQCEWIREGLSILRGHGLSPRIFVAPRHGFDRSTLRALDREGLGFLSDGFASRLFKRDEIVWIPQQLWEPMQKPSGLWTICIHTNTAPEELEEKLDRFLLQFRQQFISFDDLVADNCEVGDLGWKERLSAKLARRRVRSRSGSRPHRALAI